MLACGGRSWHRLAFEYPSDQKHAFDQFVTLARFINLVHLWRQSFSGMPYFRNGILPLVDGQRVEFLGEINEREKTTFLRDAAGLLFPIDWPEPFDLVMIEAMACGTPVLAFRCGSVPEIVEDGVTGKVVESEDEAIAALPEVLSYDRRAVRERFQERFTATRIAGNYVKLYRKLLKMPANSGEKPDFGQRRPEFNGSRDLGRRGLGRLSRFSGVIPQANSRGLQNKFGALTEDPTGTSLSDWLLCHRPDPREDSAGSRSHCGKRTTRSRPAALDKL
jgi:Glycosyl transferases group 1